MRIGSVVDTLMSFIYINKYHPFTIWSYMKFYDFMTHESLAVAVLSARHVLLKTELFTKMARVSGVSRF